MDRPVACRLQLWGCRRWIAGGRDGRGGEWLMRVVDDEPIAYRAALVEKATGRVGGSSASGDEQPWGTGAVVRDGFGFQGRLDVDGKGMKGGWGWVRRFLGISMRIGRVEVELMEGSWTIVSWPLLKRKKETLRSPCMLARKYIAVLFLWSVIFSYDIVRQTTCSLPDNRPLTLRLSWRNLVLPESAMDSVPLLETLLLAPLRSRLLASSVRTRSATSLPSLGGRRVIFVVRELLPHALDSCLLSRAHLCLDSHYLLVYLIGLGRGLTCYSGVVGCLPWCDGCLVSRRFLGPRFLDRLRHRGFTCLGCCCQKLRWGLLLLLERRFRLRDSRRLRCALDGGRYFGFTLAFALRR